MHRADANPAFDDHPQHVSISLEPADVIDDLGTLFDRPGGDRGLGGVDRDRHAGPRSQQPDHLAHPLQLLLERHRLRVGAGTLAANVEDLGSLRHEPQAMGHGRLDVGVPSAV